jgi:hypothetical protein
MTKKGEFLHKIQQAFAGGDTDFIAASLTDDAQWNIVGERTVDGKEAIVEALEEMEVDKPRDLTIHNVITHGAAASVDGIITNSKDGSEVAFCDVFKLSGFKNPKIKRMTSYVVRINSD